MGFYYATEKKKFDKEWEQMELEYRSVGMSDEQIASMKEYDWKWFCSQRVFLNHTQALPSEQDENYSLFKKFQSLSYEWDTGDVDCNRYGWLSAIEDENLLKQLLKLSSDDLELLTLIFIEGYRQTDIAKMRKCSRNAIYKQLKKIKNILQNG